MSNHEHTTDPARLARLAGFFYLVIIVCGVWSEGFVRSMLVVPGDASATVSQITQSAGLLRASFAADTFMALSDVAVGALLFMLLKPVSLALAVAAFAFRLTQAAVLAMNLLSQHVALMLATGTTGLDVSVAGELALLSMTAQSHGYDLGLIFFGVNSLLTGWLVARSGFLPKALGWGLVAAGAVYLLGSYLRFLAPAIHVPFQAAYLVPVVAETAFCLWLLVKGIDTAKWRSMH